MTEQKQQQQKKETNTKNPDNIQFKALDSVRRKEGKTQFRTTNGTIYELDVKGTDRYTVLGLENEDDDEYTMLFKHAIESFRVPRKK